MQGKQGAGRCSGLLITSHGSLLHCSLTTDLAAHPVHWP